MGEIESIIAYTTSISFTAMVNVLTIVSFAVTIYVGLGIRKIRSHYVAKIRVPELKLQLTHHVSELGGFFNDYSNNKELIATEIAQIEPVLQAIKKRLGWSERTKINHAIKMLVVQQKNAQSDATEARSIYNALNGVIAELEQWENDKKWSE